MAQKSILLPSDSYLYINKWGSKGSEFGQFLYPSGIVIDSSNNVYITDNGNNRIQKFDNNGNFITTWDFDGPDPGHIIRPEGIAIDSSGSVFIDDYYTSNILKFDGNGKLITKWGSYGTSNGQFIGSGGIAINSSGYVYVTDGDNNRIQVFAPVIPGILSTIDHNANANSLIPDNATSTNEKMTTPQAGISDQV